MGLMAQRPFHGPENVAESRGMSRNLKGFQERRALPRRKVELPGSSIRYVDGDDAGQLFAEGLHSDWCWHLVIVRKKMVD